MKLNTVKKLMYTLLTLALVFIALCYSRQWFQQWSILVVLGFLGAYMAVWALFWVCPHCKTHLGRLDNARYCKHCGKNLYPD